MQNEILINITGWLNCGLFTLVAVPQIYKTVITKKTQGVSIWVFVLMLLANIDAFVYATLIEQSSLQVKYVLGFIGSFTYIIVYLLYKRKEHKND